MNSNKTTRTHFKKIAFIVTLIILIISVYYNFPLTSVESEGKTDSEEQISENQSVEEQSSNEQSSEDQSVEEPSSNEQTDEVQSVEEPTSNEQPSEEQSSEVVQEETDAVLTEEPKEEPATETSKTVYLTFDDGPYKLTPKLLDILDRYNVKATFFVTAQFLEEEDLIKQIRDIDKRGHTVAVHTYSHDYKKIYSSVDAYVQDYKKMDDIIYKATGKRSKIFRFPGGSNGSYNKNIRTELIEKMKSLGLTHYDWNAYDGDCDGLKGQALINRAVRESSYNARSILLLHDIPGKETVIESMPAIIERLQEKGYSFAPLDETVAPIQFIK